MAAPPRNGCLAHVKRLRRELIGVERGGRGHKGQYAISRPRLQALHEGESQYGDAAPAWWQSKRMVLSQHPNAPGTKAAR